MAKRHVNEPYISQRETDVPLRLYKRFNSGNFWAEEYPGGCERVSNQRGTYDPPRDSTYVVYSYLTPIAWVEGCGRAVFSPEHFSPSTSQHQHLARYALKNRPDGDEKEIARRVEADRLLAQRLAAEARVEHEKAKAQKVADRTAARERAKQARIAAAETRRREVEEAREVMRQRELVLAKLTGTATTSDTTSTLTLIDNDTTGAN